MVPAAASFSQSQVRVVQAAAGFGALLPRLPNPRDHAGAFLFVQPGRSTRGHLTNFIQRTLPYLCDGF